MSDISVLTWIVFLAHIAIAVIYCFWGYRHFRTLISIYVFLFVFPSMLSLISGRAGVSDTMAMIISLVIAIAATALTWIIYKVAIFAGGGFLGLSIASFLFESLNNIVLTVVISIILFILLGILALKFRRVIIILSSAIIGAFSLFVYGYYLVFSFGSISSMPFTEAAKLPLSFQSVIGTNYLLYLVPIILAIIGIVVQSRSSGGRVRTSKRERRY